MHSIPSLVTFACSLVISFSFWQLNCYYYYFFLNPGHLVKVWVSSLCNQPSSHWIISPTCLSILCESILCLVYSDLGTKPVIFCCLGATPHLFLLKFHFPFCNILQRTYSSPVHALYSFQPNRMWQRDYIKRLGALFLYLSVDLIL